MTQSELLKSIRKYFWRQKFTEIEIPYLNPSLPLEANIYSFKTTWQHQKKIFYLPTSPELGLKQYLTEHHQDCFAISHCFRDLEAQNELHTPEFLMLEWYQPYKNFTDLINFTQKFIRHFIDIDFIEYPLPSSLPDNEVDFNQYFLNQIEPKLPRSGGVFVTGYPSFLSPLAQSKKSEVNNFSARSERDPASAGEPEGSEDCKNSFTSGISERFELYIQGVEIANGCTENTDSTSISQAFTRELKYRQKNHLPLHPISPEFIQNCAQLGQCSGVGLGLDRFLKVINLKMLK